MRRHLNALHVRAAGSKMPSRRTSTLSLRMAVRQSASLKPTIIRFRQPPAVARRPNSIDSQAISAPGIAWHALISIPTEPGHLMRLMRHGAKGWPATTAYNRIARCSSSRAFSSSRRPVRALPASVLSKASAIGSIP